MKKNNFLTVPIDHKFYIEIKVASAKEGLSMAEWTRRVINCEFNRGEKMKEPKLYITKVTPEIADHWLTEYVFQYQRDLKRDLVLFFADEMEKGRFDQYTDIIFAINGVGRKYLLDGQHRLNAVVKSRKEIYFIVKERQFETNQEIRDFYGTIDIGKIRTHDEIFKAKGLEPIGLSSRKVRALFGALKLIHSGFQHGTTHRVSYHMMYPKLIEWAPYYRRYFDIISINPDGDFLKKLQRVDALATALATLRFSDEKLEPGLSVSAYWHGVSSGNMIESTSPIFKYRELVFRSQLRTTAEARQNMTPKEFAVYTRLAWNAYTEGRAVKQFRYPKNTKKVGLNCTPFNFSLPVAEYKKCFENSQWPGWENSLGEKLNV